MSSVQTVTVRRDKRRQGNCHRLEETGGREHPNLKYEPPVPLLRTSHPCQASYTINYKKEAPITRTYIQWQENKNCQWEIATVNQICPNIWGKSIPAREAPKPTKRTKRFRVNRVNRKKHKYKINLYSQGKSRHNLFKIQRSWYKEKNSGFGN